MLIVRSVVAGFALATTTIALGKVQRQSIKPIATRGMAATMPPP